MNRFITALYRYKILRISWQLLTFLSTLPLNLIGYVIPKRQSLWVFGNTFGYKDNARYLFEYVNENHPEISAVWISPDTTSSGVRGTCYSRFGILGLWYQFRAGVAFLSTGKGDLARFVFARKKIIQLWHGIPIKKILLDSPESVPFKKESSFLYALSLWILKGNLRQYSLIMASSVKVQKRLEKAFGLPSQHFAITGYPRHDIIVEKSTKKKKWILYAPTWRSDIESATTIVENICNELFIYEIEKLGYELWVSIHPLNRRVAERVQRLDSIHQVSVDCDINKILAQCEILITDYSSIAIDFSLLDRKIIFFTPDMGDYMEGRGIYEEFRDIIEANGVVTSAQVLGEIGSKETVSPISSVPAGSFFQYNDTLSRKRIVETVKCLFSQ